MPQTKKDLPRPEDQRQTRPYDLRPVKLSYKSLKACLSACFISLFNSFLLELPELKPLPKMRPRLPVLGSLKQS